MRVAADVAARSACGVRRVGAVVVSPDNRDHWIGYNGPPAGFRGSLGLPDDSGCASYCPQGGRGSEEVRGVPCVAIHAEVNALMQSDRRLRAGGTVYVTAAPCWKCALAVANSGVARLVCPDWEDWRQADALRIAGVYRDSGLTITHEGTQR